MQAMKSLYASTDSVVVKTSDYQPRVPSSNPHPIMEPIWRVKYKKRK